MRRSRVLGSALGVLVVAGCVMPANGTSSSPYDVAPTPQSPMESFQRMRDSAIAQAVADKEGPGVSINVEFASLSGSRRAQASFHLDDDAYVIVGHIDGDGVMRITFPADPKDDGFVQGQHTYRTPEFFAGFVDQYRYNARNYGRPAALRQDAYDGALGYAFVIASWRPMHFDRFSTDGRWDSFELADPNYMNDPRPAIYELASLLSGENREAYTVKLAHYINSSNLYGGLGYSSFASSAYGGGYCYGSSPFGFESSPFDSFFGLRSPANLYGQNFSFRGSQYAYDSFQDCYRRSYGGYYGNPYGQPIADNPITPIVPTNPRAFRPDGKRSQPEPQPLPGYKAVLPTAGGNTTGNAETTTPTVKVSPHYRDRGLITADDPTPTPGRGDPRVGVRAPVEDHSRPSIEQMVNRRGSQTDGNYSGYARAQRDDNSRNAQQRNQSDQGRDQSQPRPSNPRYSGDDNRGNSGSPGGRPISTPNNGRVGEPSVSAPARAAPSAPAPTPSYTPRVSAPPPAPASPPPSAPASSGSSSGSSGSSSSTPVKPPV